MILILDSLQRKMAISHQNSSMHIHTVLYVLNIPHLTGKKPHHLSHRHIIFYQHFGCSVLMNSVLSTTVQTRRHEKEYAAGWLHVPEYRKAQNWKPREFIPSRRRIILWKCSILMSNTATINQKLCIYWIIECILTCVSPCAMSTEFASTTGSINPDESPNPLWFGMYY